MYRRIPCASSGSSCWGSSPYGSLWTFSCPGTSWGEAFLQYSWWQVELGFYFWSSLEEWCFPSLSCYGGVTWHFHHASLPSFAVLANPDHSRFRPLTPDLDLNICGLRRIFCQVPHSRNVRQTPAPSTISSSLPVPIGTWFNQPYQLRTLSWKLYHLSYII